MVTMFSVYTQPLGVVCYAILVSILVYINNLIAWYPDTLQDTKDINWVLLA